MKRWTMTLAGYGRKEPAGFAMILVLTLVGVGLAALMPWPLKIIVDHLLRNEPVPEQLERFGFLFALPVTGALIVLVGATLVLFISNQLVKITQTYIERGVGDRMMYALAADIFNHAQRQSLRYHDRQLTGDLVRRITSDTQCVRDLLMGVVVPLLTALVTLLVFFTVMWSLSPPLTLIALLAAVPLPWIIRLLEPRMAQSTYEHQEIEGGVMALAEQTLSAMPVVQAFDRRRLEVARFRKITDRSLRAYLRSIAVQLQFKIGVSASTAVGTAAMLSLGGFQVLDGQLTIGSLLVFLAYLASLYGPVETLAHLGSSFATAAARARRVFEILDSQDAVEDRPDSVPMYSGGNGRNGDVKLESVSVGYEPGHLVLEDVTLEVKEGETVALVGRTGSGKSTLASLLLRFLDPWEGRVVIGGRDIRDIRLSSLRDHIGLVLQEPFLLPISVAANIAYGRPEASHAEIVAAARAANADEFIRQLADGYDTVLGERGATLSGGQSQRISIARALLKDAPILILDEPTSALDAETEALLLAALERLMSGRTTFIIAHRLSTIRHADQIVVLENGRIVEIGKHDQLLKLNGAYARFHQTQYGSHDGPVRSV
jgi:ATP-binding cassette subfamily B protein/subfamily B ATP-binding cassette protein MsbA